MNNGDTITVEVSFNRNGLTEVGYCAPEITKKTYTVSGLTELTQLDPFASDFFILSFSGFSGLGQAEMHTSKPEGTNWYLSYKLSKGTKLSNGDTVTVSFTANTEKMGQLGYSVRELGEKTFTISGLPAYYTLNGKFPEKLQAVNKASAEKTVNDQVNNLYPGEKLLSGPEYIKAYYLQAKDIFAPYQDWFCGVEFINAVCIVEKYTLDLGWSGVHRTYWYGYLFQDYYIDDTSAISYNIEKKQYFCFTVDTLQEFEAALKNECTMLNITTIG